MLLPVTGGVIAIANRSQLHYMPDVHREIFMVVCICNAIREHDVRGAARAGAGCPKSAYAALGHRPRCGQCLPFARDIVHAERAGPAA